MKNFKLTPLALLVSLAVTSPHLLAQQVTDVGRISVEPVLRESSQNDLHP